MKNLRRDTILLMILSAAWVILICGSLWPTSYWFEVKHITVNDATLGEPVIMEVDRTIKRPFYAEWTVTIREAVADGYVIRCLTKASTDYRVDATFPDPLTLDWWSNSECNDLDEGSYVMTTTWDIRPDILGLPKKTLTVESNIFKIK